MSLIDDVIDWLTGKKNTDQTGTSSSSGTLAETSDKESVNLSDTNKTGSVQSASKTGSTGSSSSSGAQNVSGSSTGTTTGSTSGSQQTQTQQASQQTATQDVSSLSQGSLDLLKQVVGDKAAGAASGDYYSPETAAAVGAVGTGASALNDRVTTGANSLNDAFSAIENKAKLDYSEGTLAQINQLAQSGGGSMDNSFIQLLLDKGNRDLNTNIAAQKANYTLNADQLNTQAATAATGASATAANAGMALDAGQSQALQEFLSAIGVEKGATTSATSTAASTTMGSTGTQTSQTSQQTQAQQTEQATQQAQQMSQQQSTETAASVDSAERTQTSQYAHSIEQLVRLFEQSGNTAGTSSTTGSLADFFALFMPRRTG